MTVSRTGLPPAALLAGLLLVSLVTACSSPAETTTTAPSAGQATSVSSAPAATGPGAATSVTGPGATTSLTESLEVTLAGITSLEELEARFQEAVAGGRSQEAYLIATRYLDLAPSDADGYIWAVQALSQMSKDNYGTMDALVQEALSSIDDRDRLARLIREVAPDLAESRFFVADTTDPAALNTNGNTSGNMASGGLIAFQGEWAYFSNQVDEGKLYKIKPAGPSERGKICDDSASCINIVGSTIYYRNDSDGGTLYSIRTDGEKRTKLGGVWCEFVSVENGWIYFGTGGDDPALSRMRTDGSEPTEIVPMLTKYPYVSGDWVYYVNKKDGGSLWRISASGGQAQRLVEGMVDAYDIMDGKLYYMTSGDSRWVVYRAELDGSGSVEVYVVPGKSGWFNAYDGLLFIPMRPAPDRDVVVVYDLASQKVLQELNVVVSSLACGDGVLVYGDEGDGNRLYRLEFDNWGLAAKLDE